MNLLLGCREGAPQASDKPCMYRASNVIPGKGCSSTTAGAAAEEVGEFTMIKRELSLLSTGPYLCRPRSTLESKFEVDAIASLSNSYVML